MDIKFQILNLIKEYDKIIIHRHKNPDGDAIGSQYGLYLTLKHNFADKEIYVVGDTNDRMYQAKMDHISDDKYLGALVIVCDTAAHDLISGERYLNGEKLIIIDHHQSNSDINKIDIYYKDSSFSSAAAMIADLIKTWNIKTTSEAATYIYGGIITDTNRFLYLSKDNAKKTFELAGFITSFNPDIKGYYDYLYVESLKSKKTRALFADFETTTHGVAYRKNTKELVKKSGLDTFSVSRGMVNQMAGIKEIPIWASFTEGEDGKISVEIRSRGIKVVDIAVEFGGGGHNEACGATVDSFIIADQMIEKLDERAKQYASYEENTKEN
ncbi:bifunctional oligoribonuclease/PAP phosphatase NrnA [Acholeplasma sp. OttesenSCG-928-E16]|nr:bifunctional oligoribonuclease/PAP phosphatase NrnA [Acholeplasma sp. OttesenSCG-928-E16]